MEKKEIMYEIQECSSEERKKILYMANVIFCYRHDEERSEHILEALRDCL